MRSITSRNFSGGFWGGVLGILAFAWYPPFLPVGCFLGVILGFWYQELWIVFREQLVQIPIVALAVRLRMATAVTPRLARAGRASWNVLTFVIGRIGWLMVIAGRAVYALMSLPRRLAAWWQAHPVNRAFALRGAAIICYLIALWRIEAWVRHSGVISMRGDGLRGLLMLCAGTGFAIPLILFIAIVATEGSIERMRVFYRIYARYAALGATRYFLTDFIALWLLGVLGAAFMTIGLGAIFVAIALMLLGFLYVLAMAAIRAVYRVSVRPDHWPCFAVTLAVTAIAAWFTAPLLDGVRLWLVALATGCAAGAASEGLRRAIAWYCAWRPAALAFLFEPVEHQLLVLGRPLGRFLMQLGSTLEERLLQPLHARVVI